MTLRSQPSQSHVTRVDLPADAGYRFQLVEEREAGWLLRHHVRFARTWGRGWAWRDSPRAGSAWEERDEPAPPADAYTVASLHLASPREGARPPVPIVEGPDGGRSTLLLPPTRVNSSPDVSACVADLLEWHDRLPERALRAACTLLAEMGQNVCDHSGSSGIVAASWTPELEEGEGTLCLAILDAGIGIPASIARRYRDLGRAAPAPGRALRTALHLDAWPDRQRGTGLCGSRRLIERYGGALHVRSGGVVTSMGAGGTLLSSRCPRRFATVPGTQVCIRLRLGRTVWERSFAGCPDEKVDNLEDTR